MTRDDEPLGGSPAPGEVRIERRLPGPVERIWAYITESAKRGVWLAPGEIELRVGGSVEHRFRHADLSHETTPPAKYGDYEGGHVMHGTVTHCDPPHGLSYTWGEGADHSEVMFELRPLPDGDVTLVVTQRRLRSRAGMANVAAGWHTHLGILIDHLTDRAPRGFWSTHAQLEAEYGRRFAESAPTAEPYDPSVRPPPPGDPTWPST